MRSQQTGAVAVVLALGLVLGSGCVHRGPVRPQIVVLDIRGAGGHAVQRQVEDLARRRFDLVPAKRYWAMAGRLNARALTRRNVARVAARLGAVAVIESRARGGHQHHGVITLLVRDGKTGKVIEKHRLLVRRGHVVARSDAALERRFLDQVRPPAPPPAAAPARAARAQATPAPRAASAPAHERPAATASASVSTAHPSKARTADTRGKAASPAPTATAQTAVPPVHYDQSGQAIDNEVPPPPTR